MHLILCDYIFFVFFLLLGKDKSHQYFFAKNGYRLMDSSMYSQPIQTQAQYASPVFMQPVYNPHQQYSVYSIVPQSWSPNPAPYFETPLVSKILREYMVFH